MNRRDVVLAALGAAGDGRYTPAQLQKLIFLIDRNLPGIVDDGPGFKFRPYDYGPFDKTVYDEVDALASAGMARVEIAGVRGFRHYAVTEAGLSEAKNRLQSLRSEPRDYIQRASHWVRSLDFARLVKSIYEEYPEMRANSIFVD